MRSSQYPLEYEMTPIQSFHHYRRVILWMRVKRLMRENAIYALLFAFVLGLGLQMYNAGKAAGQERMMKILVPHLCVPAEAPAPDGHTST